MNNKRARTKDDDSTQPNKKAKTGCCQEIHVLLEKSGMTMWYVSYWLGWKPTDIVMEFLGLDVKSTDAVILQHVKQCTDKGCHASLAKVDGFVLCEVCKKCDGGDRTAPCEVCEEHCHKACMVRCACGDAVFCEPCARKAWQY